MQYIRQMMRQRFFTFHHCITGDSFTSNVILFLYERTYDLEWPARVSSKRFQFSMRNPSKRTSKGNTCAARPEVGKAHDSRLS